MNKQNFKVTGVNTLGDLLKIKNFLDSIREVVVVLITIDPLLIEITSNKRIDISDYNNSLSHIGNYKLSEVMETHFGGLHIKPKISKYGN